MAYDYDRLYREKQNALGAPSPEFVDFFQSLAGQVLEILDVGCGQGRDALMLLRAGHRVTGIDLSPQGISDIQAVATAEGLPFEGHVADITRFRPDRAFDVVLIDRTLHMLAASDQSKLLARLIRAILPQGWLLIADEPRNLPRFREMLVRSEMEWDIVKFTRGYLFAFKV